jgi:uncharacterized ferritin-like protein (DUF455 family)
MESGFKKQDKLLSQIVWLSNGPNVAPRLTERHGEWCEFIVAIGKDEVAHITMTDDALKALCERNGLNYKYIKGVR